MSTPNSPEFKAALKAVFTKAASDADFRALALSNPVAALNQVSDLDLPADTSIKFAEPSDEQVIVLPPFGFAPDAIDVAELTEVSGGASYETMIKTCKPTRNPCCRTHGED